MAIIGDPRALQDGVERQLRAVNLTLAALLGASLALVLAIAIPGTIAAADHRSNEVSAYATTQGTVVNGRGEAPETSELLVRYRTTGGEAYELWMPVSSFRQYEVGSPIEVAYPRAQPSAGQVASECGCLPVDPLPWLLLPVLLGIAVVSATQLWTRFGRVADRADIPPVPVRAWWAGPRSRVLRLYHPDPPPGSGHSAGSMVGTGQLPYSYRALIADGDTVLLHLGTRRSWATLSTPAGRLAARFRLTKPTMAKRTAGPARSRTLLADIGRTGQPIGPHEAQRLDVADAIRLGIAPMFVLLWSWRLPAPWSLAVVLGFIPILVGIAATVWARLGGEHDLDFLAAQPGLVAQGYLDPRALEPPPPPPPSPELGSHLTNELFPSLSGDSRSAADSGSWLGSRLSMGLCGMVALLLVAMAPLLLVVPVVGLPLLWKRSPRPVIKRYYRPGLPPWLALTTLGIAAACWASALGSEPTWTGMWAGPTAVALTVVGAAVAARVATAGVTVGRDEWVVRNLTSTVRIPAEAIAGVERRPKRGVLPSAGVIIHRRAADPIVVPRFTVSRAVAKRMVRDHDRAIIGAPVPPSWVTEPHPVLHPSPYGRTF